tara:strand:- start:468 stop:668 length:201 start_codon:yes stop_codon:yes gene_type:complete
MKKRTRQQLVDPWGIPPSEPIEVFVVEEEENITEEVELTVEQLKYSYDLTTDEVKKIWTDHRRKNG